MAEENQEQLLSDEPEKLTRGEFVKIAGTVAAVLAGLGINSTLNKQNRGLASSGEEGEHRWGMLIDTNLCIGCNYCTYACMAVNDLCDELRYNVVTTESTLTGEKYFLSRPCMHCDDPPCVHVCPVEATYVRPDGIVTMDYDRCIGCRYCQIACPYDVRVFNWHKHDEENPLVPDFGLPEVPRRPRGVMEKCTFCEHRIDRGLERGMVPGVDDPATPACVVACPTGARVFGDLKDENSPISQALVKANTWLRLREDLSTNPKVYYIPPKGGA